MHQLKIDEAIAFEKGLAMQRRLKALRKSNQSFPFKNQCMKRWIEEANKHEQIALLLERLKNIEMLERTK